MNSTKSKIIWAVNPSQNPADSKALVKEMRVWAKKLNCDIQPVAVFSKLNIGFPAELNLSWGKSFEELAKASVQNYLKKLPVSSFLEPEIIFTQTLSTRKMASELAGFAKKERAAMIFAHTRIKKIKSPLRLGGFVETLISLSEVPVLLMKPSVAFSAKRKSILLPTDLSEESEITLSKIKPWATSLQAKIFLYNQVEFPEFYANDFAASSQINQIMKQAEITRNENLQKISKGLEAENIKSSVITARTHKYLGAQIIEVARKNKVELIVVTNQSGPLFQAILGSVTRDVLVQAKCPVLVFHHSQPIKSKSQFSNAKQNTEHSNPVAHS